MNKNIIFTVIENFLNGEEYRDCDDYIKTLNMDEIRDELLVGVVHITYRHRDNLNNWNSLFEKVDDELYRRGLDRGRMLQSCRSGNLNS